MPLTRDHKETVRELLREDPVFARMMLIEAVSAFLQGEAGVTRIVLRDLVYATVGFEAIAKAVGKPAKSVQQMLSARGNPGMNNLAVIIDALRKKMRVEMEVRPVETRRKKAS